MRKTTILPLSFLALMLSSCVFTTLETARTVGKGHIEAGATLTAFKPEESSPAAVPELYARYGLTEKLDINTNISGIINMIGAKYQVLGDLNSKVGISLGGQIGAAFILEKTTPIFKVPVYFSWHPTQKFGLLLNPEMITTFPADKGRETNFGITTGGEFELSTRWRLRAGLTFIGSPQNNLGDNLLFSTGVGVRF